MTAGRPAHAHRRPRPRVGPFCRRCGSRLEPDTLASACPTCPDIRLQPLGGDRFARFRVHRDPDGAAVRIVMAGALRGQGGVMEIAQLSGSLALRPADIAATAKALARLGRELKGAA